MDGLGVRGPTRDLSKRLRELTPARVGLGRMGVSMETHELLDFQRCHAQARDAVHAHLEAAALAADLRKLTGGEVLQLHSLAMDRAMYLQRPDLGRKLDEKSRELLTTKRRAGGAELALIVADGLSALAVERHAAAVIAALLPRLKDGSQNEQLERDWTLAPVCVVEQGRVAIGDEIGEALGAQVAVVLIGERPGLSSPDSLGAYITWNPRLGRTDAERNCISNIRPEGLNYADAAAQLAFILAEARRLRLSGVALKRQVKRLEEAER